MTAVNKSHNSENEEEVATYLKKCNFKRSSNFVDQFRSYSRGQNYSFWQIEGGGTIKRIGSGLTRGRLGNLVRINIGLLWNGREDDGASFCSGGWL